MPSRLSSLLVRDGLVGVKRMEKAFQRQVIYGGSLDTILLEMNLVPEERLTQYLALASGLPPAERDEGTTVEEDAIAVIPRELAERYRAVPLTLDGETIRVLVCSPLEITELEDLADQLDRPLQPLITPEYRWHLVYSIAYSLDPPARFTTLARSLEVDPTVAPVGRSRSVIVEERGDGTPREVIGDLTERTERTPALADATKRLPQGARPPADAPSTLPLPGASRLPALATPATTPRTTRSSTPPVRPPSEIVDLRGRTSTLVGVKAMRPDPAPPAPPPAIDGVPAPRGKRPSITFIGAATAHARGPASVPTSTSASGSVAKRPSGRMSPLNKRPNTQPIATEGRDEPLPIQLAREQLAVAEDRDTVFLTLLRACRTRARWAGLLTVQGGAAIGRVAISEPGLDTAAVNTVLIPLDAVSPFRTVVSNHQPHVGALVSGDPGIDSMVLRLGGTMPPSALVLPIVLRERVVAIAVAHRVHSDLELSDVTELLPLAHAASEAIGRLIVKHKSAGYRAPSEAHVVEIEAELVDTQRYNAVREDGSPWRAPERSSIPVIDEGLEVSITAEPPRTITAVLDEIEGTREGHAEAALADAVDRSGEALVELHRRFPGKLRVDRFAVAGRALRASQYGGLLELVVRLGSVSADLLIEKMASPHRDERFYATVCTAELRPRTAVLALAERLFDQDYGVRACAIEALAGYPVQDLGTALVRARRAVHSSDPEVVAAATAAIVELGDTEAILELIRALDRSDRGGEHARRALVALTAQDFGSNGRKWRRWYETARGRHRIEWLIDGLLHKEDANREIAINDLRRLTGEYFGYHHDLPRREREAAAVRWVAWWRESGHRRFVIRENERHRPTAQLPGRRPS